MGKGESTHQAILEHATSLATRVGLGALSIGGLAENLRMSKSGLFAHFKSKEALQLEVLEHASSRFVGTVVRPAIKAPRGEPRVRAFFDRWLEWPRSARLPGGCPFLAASTELDDRPGPLRDRLVQLQRDMLDTLATAVRQAIAEKHFRSNLDPDQFAHDLWGIMAGAHHAAHLLEDPKARDRARNAFERLLRDARIAGRC
jgi:AcrR family transcriptional regulator